jgi:hypothetical protein
MPQVIAATAPRMRARREVKSGRRLTLGLFASLVVEYQRAIAAEQRYHALYRASRPTRASSRISHVAVPRRIFEEFYSSTATGEPW